MIMGEISKHLHVKLKAMASNVLLPRSSKGRKPSPQTPDIARLIEEGIDPVHAAYIFVHHIASVFAENVSQLLEMWTFTKEVGKAEDDYLPDGPPMSPLTRSYFTSWAFFDHRIGKTTDTLASCLIDANDIIWMNPDQLEALKKDWIDFLRRNMVGIKASSEAEALHWLLKFGPRMNYWNEFVLLAYHNQANAIYLSGIPDLKSTLPHA